MTAFNCNTLIKAMFLSKSHALAPDEEHRLDVKLTGWGSLANVIKEGKQNDHNGLFEPCILQIYKNTVINFSVMPELHSQTLPFTCHLLLIYLFVCLFIYLFAIFFFFFSPWLSFLELHCTKWSLTVMQTPMFPWKPLSTTEYTRAIFEPFVHLINYVFVLKAAWLDCLIMY